MAALDWKKLVGGIAPILGTALAGPLGGEAVALLGSALGLGDSASSDDIAAHLGDGKLSGEQIVAVRQAGDALKIRMAELNIDLGKLNAATEQAYVTDTSDARHTFGTNDAVFILGVCIIGGFAILMGVIMFGMYEMITGKVTIDQTLLTVIAGMLGTIIGYLAGNAQQVVSYFFGSSKGSKDAAAGLQTALTTSMSQVGNAVSSSPVPLVSYNASPPTNR